MEQLLTMSGLKFDPSCSISLKHLRVSVRVRDKNVERIIGHGSDLLRGAKCVNLEHGKSFFFGTKAWFARL
jgi:hypothetical protein